MVDWGFAGRIGGIGFGLVFGVLIVLALAMWATGLLLRKFAPVKADVKENKKG